MGLVQSDPLDIRCVQGDTGPLGPPGLDGRDGAMGPTGADLVWSQMSPIDQGELLDLLAETSGASQTNNQLNLLDRMAASTDADGNSRFRGDPGEDVVGPAGSVGPVGPAGADLTVSSLSDAEVTGLVQAVVGSTDVKTRVANAIGSDADLMGTISSDISCSGTVCSLPGSTQSVVIGNKSLDRTASSLCVSNSMGNNLLCANDNLSSSVDRIDIGATSLRAGQFPDGSFSVDVHSSAGDRVMGTNMHGSMLVAGKLDLSPTDGSAARIDISSHHSIVGSDTDGFDIQEHDAAGGTTRSLLAVDSAGRASMDADTFSFNNDYRIEYDEVADRLCIVRGTTDLICVDAAKKITVDDMLVIDEDDGVSLVSKADNTELMYISNAGEVRFSGMIKFPMETPGVEETFRVGDAFEIAINAHDPATAGGEDYIGIRNSLLFRTQAELDAMAGGLAAAAIGDPDVLTIKRPDRNFPEHIVELGNSAKLVVGGYELTTRDTNGGVLLSSSTQIVQYDTIGRGLVKTPGGILINAATGQEVTIGHIKKIGNHYTHVMKINDTEAVGFDNYGRVSLLDNDDPAANPQYIKGGIRFGDTGYRVARKSGNTASKDICFYKDDVEHLCIREDGTVAEQVSSSVGADSLHVGDHFIIDTDAANSKVHIYDAATTNDANKISIDHAGYTKIPGSITMTSAGTNAIKFFDFELRSSARPQSQYEFELWSDKLNKVIMNHYSWWGILNFNEDVVLRDNWKMGIDPDDPEGMCYMHFNNGTWHKVMCIGDAGLY